MRKKIIAGNWKMNGLKADAVALAKAVFEKMDSVENRPFEVLVCPPMNVLGYVTNVPHASVFVGAQDVAETTKPNGAFTGDVSAAMVKDLGATWTLVGHSERRTYHHETDAVVRQKAENAISNGLTVVICIGETLEEREAGKALEVVTRQVRESTPAVANATNCVLAYEPVWAIGTGKVPTNDEIEDMTNYIKDLIQDKYGSRVLVLYGGSVNQKNIDELNQIDAVDGYLIGGASTKADEFLYIMSKCE